MKEQIEIIKFKITIFMAILGGVGFLIANIQKVEKIVSQIIIETIAIILVFYGVVGFVKNMLKLSKIEEKVENE